MQQEHRRAHLVRSIALAAQAARELPLLTRSLPELAGFFAKEAGMARFGLAGHEPLLQLELPAQSLLAGSCCANHPSLYRLGELELQSTPCCVGLMLGQSSGSSIRVTAPQGPLPCPANWRIVARVLQSTAGNRAAFFLPSLALTPLTLSE